jgi:hypothetical protein
MYTDDRQRHWLWFLCSSFQFTSAQAADTTGLNLRQASNLSGNQLTLTLINSPVLTTLSPAQPNELPG